MIVVCGSAVVTLGGATSLEFNIGVTLGDGTWVGITLCERRGASEGKNIGVRVNGCRGMRLGLAVSCCTVLLNSEDFVTTGVHVVRYRMAVPRRKYPKVGAVL
jgi:hypothetical protein